MRENQDRRQSTPLDSDDDVAEWEEQFLPTASSARPRERPTAFSPDAGRASTAFTSDVGGRPTIPSAEAFEGAQGADVALESQRAEDQGMDATRLSSPEADDEDDDDAEQGAEPVQGQRVRIEPPMGYRQKRRSEIRHDALMEDASGLWWARTSEGPWHRATFYTEQVRRDFLEEMGRLGAFRHPRPVGPAALDQTSYHPGQRNWGPDRPDRPDILFQHEATKKSQAQRQAANRFHFLMHKGRIVIDQESRRPVRDFAELPKAISSLEQGWALEAMARLNEWISMDDFRDRMPYGNRPSTRSLSMRRSRFRWSAGLLAWSPREGSKAIKEYLDAKLPKQCLETNSTRGFRDLYEDEQEEMKETSKGKYPERRKNKVKGTKAGPSMQKSSKSQPSTRPASRERSRSPRVQPSQPRLQRQQVEPVRQQGKGKVAAASPAEPSQDDELRVDTPQDLYDWRDEQPDELEDVRVVHYALMPARYEYYELTGLFTPFPVNQRRSYNEQYDELQQRLESLWVEVGNPIENAPRLEKRGPWYDGFPREILLENWEEPGYLDPGRS